MKIMTLQERDEIDEKIFADGGYEIIDGYGQRFVMLANGVFVPVHKQAGPQEIVKLMVGKNDELV
jgi:hypothetical protein